ncbi:MAG: zinc ribbon domain-containing protein [Sulfuricaulis sp.]|uniref:zinc ribbon domain-containing protein n=1 Tax=Sulfuricaulis sp. TaxID=2003553 RepID=UPI0034A3C0D3
MLRAITERLSQIGKQLTRLDDQPLGKAALVIIIGLDLFILVSIFDGLAQHTAQLARPSGRIPDVCRNIVIDGDWNKTNRMERLAGMVVSYSTSGYRPDERPREYHPLCAPMLAELDHIKKDKTLASGFQEVQRLNRETRDLRVQIERLKGPYDIALLESIAKEKSKPTRVESLKVELNKKTAALNELTQMLAAVEVPLAQDERIHRLWSQIEAVTQTDRERLRDDLRNLNFWYPVKRLGMELIFLLPLIVVFYLWNAVSIRKNRTVQTLVSSHLLVVTAIPVLFKIAELIYDILPKKLLQRLIEFLESLKLVALWHYVVIALAIAAALALIYLFQRKLFSREKMLQRRITRGQCQKCGRGLPIGSRTCPFCGFAQFTACKHCRQPTYVYGRFCKECGLQL